MTVKELRTLVDNLDEYIHVPGGINRLKKTILHLAVSGQLVPQDPSEGTGQELYDQIQAEKQKLIAEGKLKKQKPLSPIAKNEVPFEIPQSWKWVRLGDVSRNISYGYTESASKVKIGPKFVRITDIQNCQINWDEVPFCKIDEKNKPKYLLEDGDILFARTGGTVGKSYICKSPPDSVFASYLIRVQPSKGFVSSYLLYYFETPFYWASIYSDMSGTGQPNFNGTKLGHLLIPIPPNAEQERIVEKVDHVFQLVEQLAEKYKAEQAERQKLAASSLTQLSRGNSELALEHLTEIIRTKADAAELRKTILHLAVSGQLVPHDLTEGTGQELYDQIQVEKAKLIAEGKLKKQKPLPPIAENEVPFEIPQSWKWVQPSEVGEINPRNVVEDNVSVGFTPMAMISEDYGVVPTYEQRLWKDVKKNLTHIATGDVVLAKITPCFENSKAGIIGDMPNRVGAATTEVHVFRQDDSLVSHEFIYAWLKSPLYLNFGRTKMTGTAGQKRVSTNFFATFAMPLPPRAEQERIAKKTTELLALITKLEGNLE